MVEKGTHSPDKAKVKAAKALTAKIDGVLKTADYKWFLGLMDPGEKARRAKAAEAFRRRYQR